MAHYYARAQGNKGETTRCGTRSSGITARVGSWLTIPNIFSKAFNATNS